MDQGGYRCPVARILKVLHYTFGMASDFGGQTLEPHSSCLSEECSRTDQAGEGIFLPPVCAHRTVVELWSQKTLDAGKNRSSPEYFWTSFDACGSSIRTSFDSKSLLNMVEFISTPMFWCNVAFDDLLDNSTVAIGEEGIGGEFGVGNAVILAEPNAPFLRRWLGNTGHSRIEDMMNIGMSIRLNYPARSPKPIPRKSSNSISASILLAVVDARASGMDI